METYIRKALGMKAHFLKEVEEAEERLMAHAERLGQRRLRCGDFCLEVKRTRGRLRERRWRDLSIRDRAFFSVYRPDRVVCPRFYLKVEKVPWAKKWARVTQALALAVAQMAKKLSLKEVAD